MKYKYSETAGYYGRGGWICYTDGMHGVDVWKVFGTESEAVEYCQRVAPYARHKKTPQKRG